MLFLPSRSFAVALLAALATSPQDETPAADPVRPAPELYAVFDYDAEAELDVREHGFDSFDGYDRVDLSYASPLGGRVPAYLYVPHSDGPWAGMLLMHGMPGDRSNGARMAAGYANAGALCLAISAPWARLEPGERMEPITFTEEDRTNQIQLIQDLRRGVDLLLTFEEVDPKRLGYSGGSYGGAMGGLLAGVERRIRAYALVVGDGGLYAHMTSPGDPIPPEGLTDAQWQAWKGWMEELEPLRFVAFAAPSELLFQNGETDQLVPKADALDYQRAGSEPKTCLWYPDGHALNAERLLDQAKWFAPRIGIDPSPFEGP